MQPSCTAGRTAHLQILTWLLITSASAHFTAVSHAPNTSLSHTVLQGWVWQGPQQTLPTRADLKKNRILHF